MVTITEPGVYYDLPAADYHAQHDWLSWSRMKYLVPPSTPAHFKASLTAGEERKRHFDLGKVVHAIALGDGDEFEVVQALNRAKEPYDARDYDTKSRRRSTATRSTSGATSRSCATSSTPRSAWPQGARAPGRVDPAEQRPPRGLPLLGRPRDRREVPGTGRLAARACRGAPDARARPQDGGQRGAVRVQQGRRVLRLLRPGDALPRRDQGLGLDRDPAFLFVVVEKADPHLVSVGQFAERDDLILARAVVDHCRRLYAACLATDTWPGYGDGVTQLELPKWLHYSLAEALA
jgi:hypothetical protein